MSKAKKISIVLSLALVVILIFNYVSKELVMPNLSTIKVQPSAQLNTLKEEMYASTQIEDLSSLSLRLMTAAAWGDLMPITQWSEPAVTRYAAIKTQMLNLLHITEPMNATAILEVASRIDARQAWMLGRMMVSALMANDEKSAQNFAQIITAYLQRPEVAKEPNALSVWASGYLLEYDAQVSLIQYHQNITPFLTAANDVIEKSKTAQAFSTITWIHVVNLGAAATEQDQDHYHQIKSALGRVSTVELTTPNQPDSNDAVLHALQSIPMEDFRAWAYFWTLRAAVIMHDQPLIEKLNANANKIWQPLEAELARITQQLQLTPNDNALKEKQESLRNDYVLGATTQLYAQHHVQLQPNTPFNTSGNVSIMTYH